MTRSNVYEDVVAFVSALRASNVAVGVDQSEVFAQALGLVDPLSPRDLYLAARASLIVRREDVPVFDDVYDAFWRDRAKSSAQKVPLAPRHDPIPFQRTALASFMSETAKSNEREIEIPDEAKAASDTERLRSKDFSDLTDEERAALERAIAELRFRPAMRHSRRRVASRRGAELDLRRVLRVASRRGGVALSLFRRKKKVKRRPVVVLADISGSMELYSRVLLHFFHALTQAHGPCETFVFGTRLTCITSQLRLRDVDTAIDEAAHEIADFAGGTRIGESLHGFLRLHAPRALGRGAVLVIVSDGWERGDPSSVAEAMKHLRARCHRVIWLNPLLGRARYEPLAAGMAAALPYVDDFLPLNDLQSVTSLSRHLATLPERRSSRAGGVR